MTSIVVDIGNTSTTVGLAVNRRITRVTRLDGGAGDAAQAAVLLRRTGRGHGVDGVMVASVVPRMNARWTLAARRAFGRPALFLTHRLKLNVCVDYPQPDRLGADRLANVCGAVERYGAPAIVADFGTALTFDVVSPDRSFIGGVIAPGLPLMLDYLAERTALLPRVRLSGPIGRVGRSTAGAMRLGARIGYRGMTREIAQYLLDGLGWKRVELVATGGFGRIVAPSVGLPMRYDPDLTLFGLSCVFEWNGEERTWTHRF